MGNIEVIELRTGNGGCVSKKTADIALASHQKRGVVTDADDFGRRVESAAKIIDYRWTKLNRVLFPFEKVICRIAHQPFRAAEDPGRDSMAADRVDRTARGL